MAEKQVQQQDGREKQVQQQDGQVVLGGTSAASPAPAHSAPAPPAPAHLAPVLTAPAPPKPDRRAILGGVARTILGPCFWLYVVAQVFVFNVDALIVNRLLPATSSMQLLKLPLILISTAAVWLALGNKQFGLTVLYVASYPFVVLFWKIPYLVFRQRSWNVGIAAVHAVSALARSFKRLSMSVAIYLLVFGAIWFSERPAFLYPALVAAVVLAFMSFVHRFRVIFRSPDFYRFHVKVFSFFWGAGLIQSPTGEVIPPGPTAEV